jgi:N6-L-threonylcarbamoyladenine synthase
MAGIDISFADISAVAVTYAPGLIGALLTGLSYAKALAYAIKKPLIGVNHIEGHICAKYIGNPKLKPPFLSLVASGGHTSLYLVRTYDGYEIIGQTLDDAAGEAFDKISRALGLGYPGGRFIEETALKGNSSAIAFPRAINKADNFDFSFSGLKSAVLNYLNSQKTTDGGISTADIAASFQQAIVDVLVSKTVAAALKLKVETVAMAGGVSANTALRCALTAACKENKLSLNIPKPIYCTDNAVMIATRAYFDYCAQQFLPLSLNAMSKV